MLIAVLLFLRPITDNSSANGSQRALHAVSNTLTQVLQLTLGFLLFACGVLLCTSAAQILVADQVADGFFGRAQGLVPLARRAVLVVFCDCAGVGVGGDGADPGGGVRGIVLGFAFGFLDFAFGLGLLVGIYLVGDGGGAYLGGGVAGHSAHGALGETSGLVQVGLAG